MENCPNCKSLLNVDENASGKCFSCGASFESSLPQDSNRYIYDVACDNENSNIIGKMMKIGGILIIIVGTIFSFVMANGNSYKQNPLFDLVIADDEFSFTIFLTLEIISVISGLFLMGFAEIIQLLENIKNKLK